MPNTDPDFFTRELAQRYDERNSRLAPISDCLHFLTTLLLQELPSRARILSVGAGTGADILALAQAFPAWSFVAVEPSLAMLDLCRQRVQTAGLAQRCEFFHGFIQDLPTQADFDGATALLVAHFIKPETRLQFFRDINARLRVGGFLVNAEISFDLESSEFPSMLRSWQAVQSLMGATPESLEALPKQLKEVLSVLAPEQTEAILRNAGIAAPVKFFQAFMIAGWYGAKS